MSINATIDQFRDGKLGTSPSKELRLVRATIIYDFARSAYFKTDVAKRDPPQTNFFRLFLLFDLFWVSVKKRQQLQKNNNKCGRE